MTRDARVDNRYGHAFACAYLMGLGDLQIAQMPLLVSDLVGDSWGTINCGAGTDQGRNEHR
jgi:hypothetical protein